MTIWFFETVIILAQASELSTFASTLPSVVSFCAIMVAISLKNTLIKGVGTTDLLT